LVGLGGRTALVVVVLSNGVVEKATLDLAEDVQGAAERLSAATVHLSSVLVGSTLTDLPPVPASGDTLLDDICTAAVAAVETGHEQEAEPVFVGGASRMAAAFDAVETVRQVLSILEQQYVVVTLLRDVIDRGLQVAIGTETGMAPLAECALIVAPYQVEGEPAGTIGVLGPARMDYPQALAAVAVVSHRLSKRLSEG
jgi:heat-inducible transcriptional repressor